MKRSQIRKSRLRNDYQALEPKILLAGVPEFPAEPGLYQIYSNYGRTGQIDLVNQTFNTAPFNAGTKVNAAGFRVADNFAYGIMTGSYDLVRIGSNGQIENLGAITGLPQEGSFYVGDFADDGLLYVRGSQDRQSLLGIDIDLGEVTNTISASQSLDSIYDIAFNNIDQKFYASVRGVENYLISIDLNGNVATIGDNGLSRITFGAMYADADGNVFGGSNQDGGVYRFDTQTGEAFLVGNGPASGTNDGFANASIVQEMPPLAFDDFFETDGVQSTEGNLFDDNTFGTDIDGNGDEVEVTSINGDSALVGQVIVLDTGSKLLVESDGSFQYKPSVSFQNLTVNQQIKEDFTYEITDTSGFTSTANVEVKVVGVLESDEFEGIRVTGFEAFGGKNYVRLENVGDINGDGFDDGMASMWTANNGKGLTALVYGDSNGFTENFNINNLRSVNGADGSEGSLFHGANNNDLSGYRFAGLGDVNGDGIDDIAISAKDADPNGTINAGETYVVFGSASGFGAEFDLGQIKSSGGGDGSQGFVLEGISNHDLSGMALAGVGDFNGDGLNDVAVSSKFADVDGRINTGQVYVVYGSSSGFAANISLAQLTADGGNDGSLGITFNGMRKHDLAGSEVSAGDVNGDGLGDIVITARFGDSYGLMYDVGHSYVIYGSQSWQSAEYELVSLHNDSSTANTGIVIHGSRRFTQTGSFVKIVGDLNNDGKDDLVVGLNDCNSLDTHVLDGGSSTLGTDLELVELDNSPVILLDNFDQPEDIYDDRDWDKFTFNVTLHSDVGSQVTIWGDPHVVIKMDGLTRRFDIGLGPQTIELKGGTTLTWNTAEPDWERYPKGPPLTFFNIDSPGDDLDHNVDLLDEQNFIDAETGLTEAQLREFARVLYDMKIT